MYHLDAGQIAEIKSAYQAIYQDFDTFKRYMADQYRVSVNALDFLSADDVSYCLFLLLVKGFDCYIDDWKFNCDVLCEYIGRYAEKPFYIAHQQVFGDIAMVIKRLEQQSSCSLLSLFGNDDNFYVLLIKTAHKARIFALCEQLGIELDMPPADILSI